MQHAEARLRALGAPRFDAMVLSSNATGAAAWAAMGYQPQDDWTRWIKPGTADNGGGNEQQADVASERPLRLRGYDFRDGR
jgi:hypothetical protein